MRIERWIERNRAGDVVVDIDTSFRDAVRTLLNALRELLRRAINRPAPAVATAIHR